MAPGFIDLQINGAFGVDFSCDVTDKESGERVVGKVGHGILAHGVTAYCPTVVTSPPSVYSAVLPHIVPAPAQWCQHVGKVSGPVNTSEQPNLSEVCFLALFLWL